MEAAFKEKDKLFYNPGAAIQKIARSPFESKNKAGQEVAEIVGVGSQSTLLQLLIWAWIGINPSL